MVPASRSDRQSGQAAVETALTMPLLLFMVLGIMQLGLLMQARALTQYAVYRATRAGSMNHGDCIPMMHSAIATLTPSYFSFMGSGNGGGSGGAKLGAAFAKFKGNKFDPNLVWGQSGGFTESILWLVKERPTPAELSAIPGRLNHGEDTDFDQATGQVRRLEVRIVYWYPLRLPFIDWVLTRAVLAHWGLQSYGAQNPYLQTQTANWNDSANPLAGDALGGAIRAEILRRSNLRQYSFPILASSRMRMMTPARMANFRSAWCGFP
jgi:hypothetical protein